MPTRRDDTFLLYYLEDFSEFESDNPQCIYCLSESTIQIILSALRFSTWVTRWRIDREDNDRQVRGSNIETAQKWGNLAIWEVTKDMSNCLDDGLNAIASAIAGASNAQAITLLAQAVSKLADQQCCEGQANLTTNGGVVSSYEDSDGNIQPIYGENPPAELEPGTFPPNYDDLEEYLIDKCRLANMVFDGWLLTMRGIGAFTIFNATAIAGLLGAALAGVIIFPPAAIPVMIGLVLVAGSAVVMFDEICDSLEENRTENVCALYNSDTIEAMTSALGEAINDALSAASVTGPIAQTLKLIAMLLVNSDTLSQLLNGTAALGYPDVNCDCGEGYLWHFDSDDMDWNWQQITGDQTNDGAWNNTVFSEGALVTQVQTAASFINEQEWSLLDIDGTLGNIGGAEVAVDVGSQFFPVTITIEATYTDATTDSEVFNPGSTSEVVMALAGKNLAQLAVKVGFNGGSNPSYDFQVGILSVEVR